MAQAQVRNAKLFANCIATTEAPAPCKLDEILLMGAKNGCLLS